MSIHAAKGLEFKVVFVSALHRGSDQSSPVIAFSSNAGLGAKWRNPATGASLPDTAYSALKKERKEREEEEENRLLYVAMTRAEDRLFLTYTKGRNPADGRNWWNPAPVERIAATAPSRIVDQLVSPFRSSIHR